MKSLQHLLCLICLWLVAASAQAAIEYTVTDLGTPDGSFSWGIGINAGGQVTGISSGPAFLWTPTTPGGTSGTMHDLGTLGGTYSQGTGINDSGQVAGASDTTEDTEEHAFMWTPTTPGGASGTMHDLGTLGGTNSSGNDINAAGQVAGTSDTTGDTAGHATLWTPTTPNGTSGTLHDLGTLGGTYSSGDGINDSGQVAGTSGTTGDTAGHATLWTPTTPNGASGTLHDLGTLGGSYSYGFGINASGQVVGASLTTEDAAEHAFLWTPTTPGGASGMMQDIGTLGGLNSYAYVVNAGGQVVGASEVAVEVSTYDHAFLYTSGSGIVDLNSLIDPLVGWELRYASGINDAGQITGFGQIGNETHAYLLTPVLPGDYNGNGTVGPEDYDVWKSSFGSTSNLAADGNGNRMIDAGDYTVWRDHLGATAGSGSGASANTAVPEPATLWILLAGILTMCCRRRR